MLTLPPLLCRIFLVKAANLQKNENENENKIK